MCLSAVLRIQELLPNLCYSRKYLRHYLIPDCANEYDFIDFAKNEEGTEKNEMFDEAVALFKKLWGQYASKEDGLYIGNKTY